MERVTIFVRTTKTEGNIRLRFRLTDGRKVHLYHKSGIVADLKDLDKFEVTGERKKKVLLINPELYSKIPNEIKAMKSAYREMVDKGIPLSGENFEKVIDQYLHPDKVERGDTILARLSSYNDDAYRDGVFGLSRYKHYKVMTGKIERFLTVTGQRDMVPAEFDSAALIAFRQFAIDEYKYVPKWRGLYASMNERNIPKKALSINTVSTLMRMLQAFFAELENNDEIVKSPFRRLGNERRRTFMKTRYDKPVFLRQEEYMKVMDTEVPDALKETREAFLLQCSLGCRIDNFKRLAMENVGVSPEGIPFVHYLADKTKESQEDNSEIETPVMRFALDIIKRTSFDLAVLKYVSGARGYNAKIKKLLEYCGIDRKVPVFNPKTGENEYVPLFSKGSSKICRSTHEDMMAKVQINLYASGLHNPGSDAIHRYTELEIKDKFALMCIAFKQPQYKVDSNLDIIDE